MAITTATREEARTWRHELQRKATEQRVPLAAMFELTSRCNLRCIHCYLGDQTEQHRKRELEMTTAEVINVLDQLAAAGCLFLTFTGGDPMMRRDFTEVYRAARERGFFVSVFCDGILVRPSIINLFHELPPRLIEISLYGATAAVYEAVTRIPGSYARAMAGIRSLLDNGFRVGLKTVLMQANRHELEAMEAIARELGTPFRFDGAIFPCLADGSAAPLDVRLTPAEIVDSEMADPDRRRAWQENYDRGQKAPGTDRVYGCGAGQTSLYIDPFGNVSPCLMTTHHRYSLRDKPLRGLWEEDIALIREKRYKTEHGLPQALKGACVNCPGVNRLETGDEATPSPFVLELARLRHAVITGETGKKK